MLSKKRALKKLKKKEIIRNAIVISKFSFLQTLSVSFLRLFENKSYLTPQKRKKKHPRTLCYTKKSSRKQHQQQQQQVLGTWNVITKQLSTHLRHLSGAKFKITKKIITNIKKVTRSSNQNKNHQTHKTACLKIKIKKNNIKSTSATNWKKNSRLKLY